MALAQVSLMTYLQHGLNEVDFLDYGSHQNTRNDAYEADDIHSVTIWQDFNINTILQRFGEILNSARIQDLVQHDSPRRTINSERGIDAIIQEWISAPIRRSLRKSFEYNRYRARHRLVLANITAGVGTMARQIDSFLPDFAFYNADIPDPRQRANRVPGDVKPSYKWSSEMNGASRNADHEFRQALSQVNFYMRQHHTRYSFILTNRELVAVRRLDRYGNLEISDSIPWNEQGTARHPVMTVLLGLWYLGILASVDQEGQLPGLQSWDLH